MRLQPPDSHPLTQGRLWNLRDGAHAEWSMSRSFAISYPEPLPAMSSVRPTTGTLAAVVGGSTRGRPLFVSRLRVEEPAHRRRRQETHVVPAFCCTPRSCVAIGQLGYMLSRLANAKVFATWSLQGLGYECRVSVRRIGREIHKTPMQTKDPREKWAVDGIVTSIAKSRAQLGWP